MNSKIELMKVFDESRKEILLAIQDETDKDFVKETGWPCEWMYDVIKRWQDEDFRKEDEAFIERVERIVDENGPN